MVENVFQAGIGLAQGPERLVEDAAEGFAAVVEFFLEVLPAGLWRDEKTFEKIDVLALLARFLRWQTAGGLAGDDLLLLGVEDVRGALEEEHPEDVVLVGGRIEPFLAQAVGSGVEVAFEFGEGETWHEWRK